MAKKDGQQYKQYSHEKAIRQQIRYVNDKIGEADVDDAQSFDRYFNKVLMALASLDAIAEPFKDEDDENSIGNALENATPRNMNRFEKLQFIHESLKELMELFDEENLFYETKTGRTQV